MNIFSGTKQRLIYIIPFLLSALVACQKKSISFGEEFAESYTNIVQIDTVTAALSTYKLDTFATSGSGTAIVGRFNDAAFGNLAISSYQQLAIPSTIPDITINAVFDSLTLILIPNKDYYGDTLATQQINVHEVTQTIMYAPEKSQFYNTTSFSYNPTPLGTKSFVLKPASTDSVEVRLSDAKGIELLSKLRTKADEVTMQPNFQLYFKGIALVPSSPSSSLINYKAADTAFKLRIYYHEPTPNGPNNLQIEFRLTNPGLQFNHIDINRNVAPLSSLPAVGFPEVPSASLGNKAYMQYATGLFTKITFPSLQDLLNVDSAGKILKAQLIIRPLPGTYDKNIYRLPPTITLTSTDKTNAQIISGGTVLGGSLVYDDLFGDNTAYTVDVTSFLQQQLRVNYEIRQGLLLHTTSTSQFYRMVIGDRTAGKYETQLIVYYLTVR